MFSLPELEGSRSDKLQSWRGGGYEGKREVWGMPATHTGDVTPGRPFFEWLSHAHIPRQSLPSGWCLSLVPASHFH